MGRRLVLLANNIINLCEGFKLSESGFRPCGVRVIFPEVIAVVLLNAAEMPEKQSIRHHVITTPSKVE